MVELPTRARVVIIGLGGLGSPLALYLAAAGVGHLVIVDDDRVDLSNLQRQIMHRTQDIGRTKTESARAALSALNPDIKITCLLQPTGKRNSFLHCVPFYF